MASVAWWHSPWITIGAVRGWTTSQLAQLAEQNICFWWGNISRMQWLGQLLHANVSVDKTLSCTKLLTCARVGRWLLIRGILFDKMYRSHPLHHTYHTHFFMNMLLDWRMSFRQMFSTSLFLVRYEPCQGFYHTHPVYFETLWQWRVSYSALARIVYTCDRWKSF